MSNLLGVISVLLVVSYFKPVVSACFNMCPPVEVGWRSNVRVEANGSRFTVITWDQDTSPNTSAYVVLYRQQSGVPSYIQSTETTVLRYNITGLTPSEDYEVQVCRASVTVSNNDDCGSCLLCFQTIVAQEPPEAPTNVRIQITNSEIFTVLWDSVENAVTYHVLCVKSSDESVALNGSQPVALPRQLTGLDFLPDTQYNCSVRASNEFGFGLYSEEMQATTPSRTSVPGVLLMVFNDSVDYTELTESNLHLAATYTTHRQVLFSTPSTVRGLDYNYYNQEIYFTAENKSIMKVDITQTSGTEIMLSVQGDPDVILSLPPSVDSLGALTVDWVYNELYWVEFDNPQIGSRIMRGVLNNGNLAATYCVVNFNTDITKQIKVDPLHGYFYWNDASGLHRVVLSSVRVSTSRANCMNNIQGRKTLISTEVLTFTFESDEIYFIGYDTCFSSAAIPTNYSQSVANLNGENLVSYNPSSVTVSSLASFTQTMIFAANEIVGAAPTTNAAACPVGQSGTINLLTQNLELVRTYRTVQQPQPVPTFSVSNVKVVSTSTSAIVTWSPPQFIGSLFSSSAFNHWDYDVEYHPVQSTFANSTATSTSFSVTLTNLMPGTVYELNVIARGPGGSVPLRETLLFSTKGAASADSRLLIATQTGVIQANFNGANIECVGGDKSQGSNGVAYDSYSEVFYWTIDGSLGKLIGSRSSMVVDAMDIFERLPNPFSLKLDWVARRLFWVQDGNLGHGSHTIMSAEVNGITTMSEQVFEATPSSIETIAIDSLNGYLFWVIDNTINWRSLSGIKLATCYTAPSSSPTALTVDPDRQRLYWLSNAAVDNGHLSINQLEYNNTECVDSITARELPDIQFSSSATVLAYASDTLFIASQTSSDIYVIPSRIENLSSGQRFAVSTIQLTPVCRPDTLSLLSIKDIAIVSTASQPLPAGLTGPQRSLTAVTPDPIPSPPILGSNSNSTTIVIQWTPPNPLTMLPDLPFQYLVEYYLSLDSSTITKELVYTNSLTLLNQLPSTTVTSQVTVCTPWQCSVPSQNSTFISPPDFPGQVVNVRAYVYKPLAKQDSLSALVVWDTPSNSIVENFTISVVPINGQVLEIEQPTSNSTYHTILMKDLDGLVSYPLVAGSNYTIQVTANNPTGSGPPSITVTLSFNSPNYPRQVVVVDNSNLGQVIGMDSMQASPLSIPFSSPTVVDTVERQVYYYDRGFGAILTTQLEEMSPAGAVPLLLIDPNLSVLDLAYDWLGQEVYYAVRNGMTESLELYMVFVKNGDRNIRLFSQLSHPITSSTSLKLTMDPFRGFLYWLESEGSAYRLYSMNLRDKTAITSTLLTPSSRRKRQLGMEESLSNIVLSSALSLDPMSSELLVCDTITGDIFKCNVTGLLCTRLVDANMLTGSSGLVLPAKSITLDETYIYWSSADTAGVFAVELSRPSTLIVISPTTNVSSVIGLSPGLQPLASQECSAPLYFPVSIRPTVQVITVGSTDISLKWDIPQLIRDCTNEVFSFPPLMYGVCVHQDICLLEDTEETFDSQITVGNLEPFTQYQVQLSAINIFSIGSSGDPYGLDVRVMTSEGVPDPPVTDSTTVFGTASVHFELSHGNLRGYESNTTYYVRSTGVDIFSDSPSISLTRKDGLTPGSITGFQIIVSNGVFNSTATVVTVTLWALAPAPVVSNLFNTTLVADIPLQSQHADINSITLQWCEVSDNSEVSDSSNDACDCLNREYTTSVEKAVPTSLPSSIQFNVSNLMTFTNFCLQALAKYRNVTGFSQESTTGQSSFAKTKAGVPDPPFMVSITGGTVSWSEPNSRGSGIQHYRITGSPVNGNGEDVELTGSSTQLSLDLSTEKRFDVNLVYSVQIIAVNGIGESQPSEPKSFQKSGLSVEAIIGIAAGGTVLLILIVIVLVLCFVCCCRYPSRGQELRSLSYMYGPDHELSNLRSAFRQTQSNNLHYTWSREDYVCTDEDLDLLSKFPRHNLKLENFIDRGEFGEVYQGTAIDILGADTGQTPVAVKTLRKGATIEEQKKFLSEASLMSNFNHPNIVKVLGVCLDNDPVYIIMELMPAGDLLKFLRDAKRDHGPALLTMAELIQVTLDVAQGCRYLEQQHFIHRDIAARNCLVSSKGADRVVKIGDFGLAKDLYSSDYYQVEGQRKLPVRWMAPEALLQGKFTVESDIWSFGILLWEIMSLGNQPYPGRINQEVLQFVTGGGRLDKPEKCPSKIYHLMQNCWMRYASERPHFDQIANILSTFLDRIKRPDSVYHSDSDEDEDSDSNFNRQSSTKTPTRTPSIRSGFLHLARTGSMKLRNSFRRHGSIHKQDEHVSQLPERDNSFHERGPF